MLGSYRHMANLFSRSSYSLHKSRTVLKWAYDWYKKKWKTLSSDDLAVFEKDLQELDDAILKKDRTKADGLAKEIETFSNRRFKRPFISTLFELLIALAFALIIATVIRQVWFEPYEIPTGSMRPTFEEQDRLIVRKTTFGINYPLKTDHIYFDPALVQRSSIAIFSGDNIDLPDTDSTYFWVFPYKKRYVKRLMGKPGDLLYFYGGQIYGVDSENREISGLLDSPWLEKLEHIPFLTFEGRVEPVSGSSFFQILFKQMNLPIGRLLVSAKGELSGEIFDGTRWIKDQPAEALKPHQTIQTYSDFWGLGNFAMSRLLTREQVQQLTNIDLKTLEQGVLYLELRHHPSLTYPAPQIVPNERGMSTLLLKPEISVIPLQQEHLNALMDHLYTARFVVSRGFATRYNYEAPHFSSMSPAFPGIPDGTYEFYFGKGYKILWGGIPSALASDHPLYSKDPQNIQRLYNLGIELSNSYAPHSPSQSNYPSRYAYFRNDDLYLLGAPILKKDDPVLVAFNSKEESKEHASTVERPYRAFKDAGPPLKDGKIDLEFLQTFGLKIPPHHYMMLGDNHAMSADSRIFGFIPQENLQGSPSLTIWPPQHFGIPEQKPYPWFTLPNCLIWGIAALIAAVSYALYVFKRRRPVFKKLSP